MAVRFEMSVCVSSISVPSPEEYLEMRRIVFWHMVALVGCDYTEFYSFSLTRVGARGSGCALRVYLCKP